MNIVLLGAPGAGKGTQAEKISVLFSCKHISTGEILRKAVSDQTPLGVEAKSYMNRGELVPDHVMVGLIRDVLPKNQGFLLDGFPRTIDQAKALDGMLEENQKALSIAVNIVVDSKTLVERMLARGRSDDRKETIEKRLEVYQNQTRPVVDYYANQTKLRAIDGTSSVDQVTEAIVKILKEFK